MVNFEKLGKVEKGNSKTYFKNHIESVQLQWLRNVLGVNKKSSNKLRTYRKFKRNIEKEKYLTHIKKIINYTKTYVA